MANRQVVDFIKKFKGRGIGEEHITGVLKEAGWSDDEIRDSLRVAEVELKTDSNPGFSGADTTDELAKSKGYVGMNNNPPKEKSMTADEGAVGADAIGGVRTAYGNTVAGVARDKARDLREPASPTISNSGMTYGKTNARSAESLSYEYMPDSMTVNGLGYVNDNANEASGTNTLSFGKDGINRADGASNVQTHGGRFAESDANYAKPTPEFGTDKGVSSGTNPVGVQQANAGVKNNSVDVAGYRSYTPPNQNSQNIDMAKGGAAVSGASIGNLNKFGRGIAMSDQYGSATPKQDLPFGISREETQQSQRAGGGLYESGSPVHENKLQHSDAIFQAPDLLSKRGIPNGVMGGSVGGYAEQQPMADKNIRQWPFADTPNKHFSHPSNTAKGATEQNMGAFGFEKNKMVTAGNAVGAQNVHGAIDGIQQQNYTGAIKSAPDYGDVIISPNTNGDGEASQPQTPEGGSGANISINGDFAPKGYFGASSPETTSGFAKGVEESQSHPINGTSGNARQYFATNPTTSPGVASPALGNIFSDTRKFDDGGIMQSSMGTKISPRAKSKTLSIIMLSIILVLLVIVALYLFSMPFREKLIEMNIISTKSLGAVRNAFSAFIR